MQRVYIAIIVKNMELTEEERLHYQRLFYRKHVEAREVEEQLGIGRQEGDSDYMPISESMHIITRYQSEVERQLLHAADTLDPRDAEESGAQKADESREGLPEWMTETSQDAIKFKLLELCHQVATSPVRMQSLGHTRAGTEAGPQVYEWVVLGVVTTSSIIDFFQDSLSATTTRLISRVFIAVYSCECAFRSLRNHVILSPAASALHYRVWHSGAYPPCATFCSILVFGAFKRRWPRGWPFGARTHQENEAYFTVGCDRLFTLGPRPT
jgi:hypothetical protein